MNVIKFRSKIKIILVVGTLALLFLLIVLNIFRMFNVQDSELPGKYKGKHGKGEDAIELKTDWTYVHLYREKEIDIYMVNEGSWKRDSDGGLVLSNYQDFTNLEGGKHGKELMEPHFEHWGISKSFFSNTVRLGGSEYIQDYFFEKEE